MNEAERYLLQLLRILNKKRRENNNWRSWWFMNEADEYLFEIMRKRNAEKSKESDKNSK